VSSCNEFTVVVPTRNEAPNVGELLTRLPDRVDRVVFVDDSDDGTVGAIATAASAAPFPVDVVERQVGRRHGGLAGAVTDGLHRVDAGWVCVLDADLQHPPEVVADLAARASAGDVDIVVACRRSVTSRESMPAHRRALSRLAGAAALACFGDALRTRDPMSGFFAVRRDAISPLRLQADGFKILLEILLTHPHLRVAELTYDFGTRSAGRSKGTVLEGLRYARHVACLKRRQAGAPRWRDSAIDTVFELRGVEA
jgi:dolichol-phosphate mannosyltransferase